jgi:hypothetical protein
MESQTQTNKQAHIEGGHLNVTLKKAQDQNQKTDCQLHIPSGRMATSGNRCVMTRNVNTSVIRVQRVITLPVNVKPKYRYQLAIN